MGQDFSLCKESQNGISHAQKGHRELKVTNNISCFQIDRSSEGEQKGQTLGLYKSLIMHLA